MTTKTELVEALARREAEKLVGTPESDWLDFKSKPYALGTAKGKRDLAADVCAFANHRGGVIVIGVRTARHENLRVEVAESLRPMPVGSVDEGQVRATVREHVHPLLHIDVRRYEQGPDKELVVIVIEAQDGYDKPFIVDLVASDDTDKSLPHAIGWPVRHGSETHWTSAERIQQLLSTGVRASSDSAPRASLTVADDAEKHLRMLEQLSDWRGWGRIVVQALPAGRTDEIPDFHGAFASAVSRWRGIRQNGFDLGLRSGSLEARPSELTAIDDDRFFCVSRSGVVTAAAVGSPDSLGWANHQNDPNPREVIINPYVIVEFPSEAVRFAEEAVGKALGATAWTLRVLGDQLVEPTPLLLKPQPLSRAWRPLDNSFRLDLAATGDVWRDAFAVVAAIYGSGYGLGQESVPFATDRAIDLQQMGT